MKKLLALLAAILLALAAIPTDAEARHGRGLLRAMGHLAFHRHHHHHFDRPHRRRVVVVREVVRQPVVVRRVVTAPAVVEPEPEAEPVDVVSENSSIATSDDVAEAEPEAKPVRKVAKAKVKKTEDDEEDEEEKPRRKVAAAGELGCKSFFPSAGVTLSVPCE